jgi:hypothetical protein
MNAKHFVACVVAWPISLGWGDVLAQGSQGVTIAEWEATVLTNAFWGAKTNDIALGLEIQSRSNGLHPGLAIGTSNGLETVCTPLIRNSGTNWITFYMPPPSSRFQMTLTDENGHPVGPTAKGRSLGRPLSQPAFRSKGINYRAGFSPCPPFIPHHSQELDAFAFSLQDYFQLTGPGTYHLKFQMNVIWLVPGSPLGTIIPRNTTNVPLIALPPVDAEFQIKD